MAKNKEWLGRGIKTLIGVIHLRPLPGSPRYGGDMKKIVALALADAKAFENAGADAVIVENFGDVPFSKNRVAPETATAMAVAGSALVQALKIPVGFNVLRNDAHSALALCASCQGSFFRVNVHSGAMVTDQGLIEGQAYETIRLRQNIAPSAKLLADVHVKHAAPLGNISIEVSARDTVERGLADALVVSGTGTGVATDLDDVRRVRNACPEIPILLGSGASAANIAPYLEFADGVIVGSSVKRSGILSNPVDEKRAAKLRRAMR